MWFWEHGTSAQVLAATGCMGSCPAEAAVYTTCAHAVTCPQPWDYHHPLSFHHALAAWYFAAPDEPPRQPPNPVSLDRQAAPPDAACAGPILAA
eukprot:7378009-Prymnesium_polylepis.1